MVEKKPVLARLTKLIGGGNDRLKILSSGAIVTAPWLMPSNRAIEERSFTTAAHVKCMLAFYLSVPF